ncbi:hypothetical protein [Rummeliibacillus stabekisii]|uniref:Uncharacterized protein n=1 Tax=Rummeliibacillus stabekisii TaxID=241244 RepID=A0A143HC85_9BACL|nr:hypothetical protein [Rummeliibacillus stabekisii]AMW99312.1 hypothetical protein ATY39_07435 [Rummeliibacillus stabekisii]
MTVVKKITKDEIVKNEVTKSTLPTIYIGPTIPKSGLQNGVILKNGIPNDAKKHVEQCPEIGKMVISAELVAESRLNIAKIGTPENKFFERIAAYVGGLN